MAVEQLSALSVVRSKVPDLVRYAPLRRDDDQDDLPTHIRTPDCKEMPVFGEELAAEHRCVFRLFLWTSSARKLGESK